MSDNLIPELKSDEEGLYLEGGGLKIRGDFSSMIDRIRPEKLAGELLIKAVKQKGNETPTVLDATAGMGEDSLLLAAWGCKVFLYESDHIIASLLRDAMKKADKYPRIGQAVSKMTLFEEDSISAMKNLKEPVDVIYLDPMFPERQKSGLIKKKFQLLQKLEAPCTNEEDLLNAAMAANPSKIVIKRPLKGPFLAGVKPAYSLKGKAIRYDVILCFSKPV